ncbi:MAG: glycine--tRNA ligase subunit beta [Pseudohongiellaceae bacterium]
MNSKNDSKDLLIEIGTEELPPKALPLLSRSFSREVESLLTGHGLRFSGIRRFATPRRLALIVSALASGQEDRTVEKFGPAVKAAFDADGKPTRAATGFAQSCHVNVEELQRADKDGVEKLYFSSIEKGRATESLLPEIVTAALAKLPVPKRMRWGSSREEFARPVHWVILLFGDRSVPAQILGVQSGTDTRGHRVHHGGTIALTNPADYESALESPGHVIADFERRKEKVRAQINAASEKLDGAVVIDENLLDEVTSLVEWPVALTGEFDAHFLQVPAEALVSSMKSHQKCFHVTDRDGKLLPRFITVANLASRDPLKVVEGNERVIRPRLADAAFFYDTDRMQTLESRLPQLEKIVFQEKLGSLYQKVERITALAGRIAAAMSTADVEAIPDKALCERAARLSKCDLVTSMVGEFPELQGVMGYYYALHDGETEEVAQALNEQYLPRFAGDNLPATTTGCVLSMADKLDTIAGLFATGQPPSGSRDPFALRRAAIGVLRILVEKRINLNLLECITVAVQSQQVKDGGSPRDITAAVFEFMLERFRAWYHDEGISNEEFESVFVLRPPNPLDFHQRIEAVHHFNKLPEAEALASANKRVSNILAKLESPVDNPVVNSALLRETAEKTLAEMIAAKEQTVTPLFEARDYQGGLQSLAEFRVVVDRFFDEVLVMCDEADLQSNRLALLARLRRLFLQVGDISCLHRS